MCATYIPPMVAPYDDSFSILEGEINHFQAQGHVLICGDLNARTGQEPDTLSTQGDKHLPGGDSIPSPICPPRHNYDNITNKNRSQLLQLCQALGIYTVNGRLWGDSYGRYTYRSSLRSSNVDYIITDLNPESLRQFSQSTDTSVKSQQNYSLFEQSRQRQRNYIILRTSIDGRKVV